MMLIPPQWQFLAKFVLMLVIAGMGAYGAWYMTSDHYQAIIAQDRLNTIGAVQAQLLANQKLSDDRALKSRDAEVQHAKDQLVINRLNHDLAGVRIKLPETDCSTMPGTGQAAADSNHAGGVAAARADEYLAETQRAIQDIGLRCATLNSDAIEANMVSGVGVGFKRALAR
jgi:hypothetical protein